MSELLSAEEFYRLYYDHGRELVDGRVVEVAWTTFPHGIACAKLSLYIGIYLDGNPIGHAMSNDTFIITRRNPDSVRGADFCFITKARMPDDAVPDGPLAIPPELVFEVRSHLNPWTELFTKAVEYLRLGVRVVAILDLASQTVAVYRSDRSPVVFGPDQNLVIPDVLPGFEVPVAKFFE